MHVDEPHVHCEGGFDPAELDRLEAMGYDVVRWRRRNLFFGGTNAVEVLPGRRARRSGRRPPRRRRTSSVSAVQSLEQVGLERRDLAVLARALAQRLLEPDGLDRDLEQLVSRSMRARGRRRREQLLLRIDAEVDARRELEVELRRVEVGQVDVALGDVGELREQLERALRSASSAGSSSSTTGSTMPVVNDRPFVSSSRRKRSPPSTTMFIVPSSSASSTRCTDARVPTSCTAPSPVASTSPNSPPVATHSSISSR